MKIKYEIRINYQYLAFSYNIHVCELIDNIEYVKTNIKHISYYISGNKKLQYYCDNKGRRNGEFILWDDNIQIEIVCNYKDDKLDGEYKEFYNNGKTKLYCYYKNDKRDGKYIEYNYNGKIIKHLFYKDDEII